uniref:Centromere protein F n=1 Tax=Scleropages formosus TaxID=113540 RepID=A0A8C9S826_SCLFO
MSWAVEEWKEGLPGRALQKIQDIEGQLDKLKKERQQKQFQMDSLEAALQKQKQKFDMEKNEAAVLKRENQSLVESCESLEKTRQKISHELQVKDQQLNYMEGQLSSSKKQIEKLEQEIRRYKNELDRNQLSHPLDPQITSTPQKTFAMPATPTCKQPDSKFEELQEKYSKEAEERKRLESELRIMQVKLLNQTSVSHKDIARQQTQSSIFPWQQEQTSSSHSSYTETPLKRKMGTSSFLWDSEETPLKQHSRNSSTSLSESASSQANEFLRATNQELKAKVSELELRLQSQEKEMKNQMNKFQELQTQLEKARKELNEKDRTLAKSRDEFSKVSGQFDQAVTKCSSVEQKLKQITEEMNCQRHNAESLRHALEQKIKDQEKEHQKELARQQNSQVALEQQLNQVKTKMSQELQQAKKDNSLLQSDIDKVTAQKSHLERDLEELKHKLCRSEQALQASQTKELNWKKTSEEMQKEKNSISSQFEQAKKKLSEAEEELKTVTHNLKHNNNLMEDLKVKTQGQSEELKVIQMKLESQSKSSAQDLENLKKTLADLEIKKETTEKEVEKQRNEIEQVTNKNTFLEKECQDLNLTLSSKQNESAELKQQTECLMEWKREKESLINNIETERNAMLNRISELEKDISSLNDTHNGVIEKMKDLEKEKGTLTGQVDSLKGELLNKCMQLEEKEHICNELQKKFEEAGQKYNKDFENTMATVVILQGQVTELEARLQQEKSKAEAMAVSHSELLAQYESVCDLAKSKDSVAEINQKEILHLQESLAQALAEQEQHLARFNEDKSSLMERYENNISNKTAEAEQANLNFAKSQLEVSSLNEQVVSLDSALKLQKHLGTELQSRCVSLSNENDDLKEKISRAEKNEERLLHEINILSEQTKTSSSLQEQLNALCAAEEESKDALQKVSEMLNEKVLELQHLSDNIKELKQQLMDAEAKATSFENENLQMVKTLKLLEQDIEILFSKNQSLQEANATLCEERTVLLKEKAAMESTTLILEEKLEALSQSCAELKNSVEVLQSKYASALELNSKLESNLNDQMSLYQEEMKAVADKHRVELEQYSSEMKKCHEKHKSLAEDLNTTNLQLQNKSDEVFEVDKLGNSQAEISNLKMNIASVNDELLKVNDSYKTVCQEREFWIEKAASQQPEIESLKAALLAAENGTTKKESVIQSLKIKLCNAELDQIKADDALKEKELTMSKIKVQLEMLQMDLEDNEVYVNSLNSQIEALQSKVNELEAKLKESESQRSTIEGELSFLKEELALKNAEGLLAKSTSEDASKHAEALSMLALEMESLQAAKSKLQDDVEEQIQKHANLEKMFSEVSEENSRLQTKAEDLRNQCCTIQEQNDGLKLENGGLKELLQIQKEECESLRTIFEKTVEQNNKTDMKNKHFEKEQIELHQQFLELLSRSFDEAIKSFDNQMEAQQQVSKTDIREMKGSLCVVQKDLEQLQKQHSSEVYSLKQKLMSLSLEMEEKLAAERQHAEVLSAELEAARLQMQGLDLGSQSLLAADSDCAVGTTDENPTGTTSHSSQDNQEEKCEDLEQNEENVQKLKSELQTLYIQLEHCAAEITSRTKLCTELEIKLHRMEEEKLDAVNKLNSATEEKRSLSDQVEKLETEVSSLKLQLETSRCQLADVMEMLESLEVAKGDWREGLFQIESDLKKVQSEKANLEKHILSMETDIEEMQKEKQKLEEELYASRKANASLEKNLDIVTSEGVQLKQELLSCTEKKEEVDQSLLKWKEKAEKLEKDSNDTKELNKMLEEDIRTQKNRTETACGNIDNLQAEKQQLLSQLEILEQTISLLSGEKEDLEKELNQVKAKQWKASQNSESAVLKMQSLEAENVRLSLSLESSLLEKGEIVSRLNSTQEEVTQMKEGIEKLRVKIEADERKKRHMSELLKEAQRKADALQDSLEKLEREKELTEQNLEDVVLQAETAKTEYEELEAEKINLVKQLEQVTTEKNKILNEKERLEKELAEKTEQLQRLENEAKDAVAKSDIVAEKLQSKLNAVVGQLEACQRKLECAQLKEQDVTCQLSALETENELLSQQLQEFQKHESDMQSRNQLLTEGLETKQHELSKCNKENEQLKQRVIELQLFREQKVPLLESEKEQLLSEKVRLEAAVADCEQKAQLVSAKCEVLQITITSLETEVQEKEDYLHSAQLLNTELAKKVQVLCLIIPYTQMKRVMPLFDPFSQLSLDMVISEKEELKRSLECTKQSLAHETKDREMVSQELLNQTRQHENEVQALKKEIATIEEKASLYLVEIGSLKSSKEQLNSALREMENKLVQFEKLKVDELMMKVAQLSKEKDSVIAKMNLWMKSCKQLEKEKLSLIEKLEEQAMLVASLEASQKQGTKTSSTEDLQKEIEKLKEALEEKSKEADESMDKYCSLLVTLHKLEETNETLRDQVSHLSSQVTASKGRRSASKALQRSPVQVNNEHEMLKKDEGSSQMSGKRQRPVGPDGEHTPSKVQETLHGITKRIRAGATPQSARCLSAQNQHDEEFRPEGLPELVKKGFANIPVGENSPFILRRTTVRRCSPRLAAKKSPLSQQVSVPEIPVHSHHAAAEGSTPQTVSVLLFIYTLSATPCDKASSVLQMMWSLRSVQFLIKHFCVEPRFCS